MQLSSLQLSGLYCIQKEKANIRKRKYSGQ